METFEIRSILAGTDLTPRSDAALRAAAAIAELTGAELHIVHAFELEVLEAAGRAERPVTFPARVSQAEEALEAQIARVVPSSVQVASRRVEVYLPQKAILERAAGVRADLIVLGRHKPHGLTDRVVGSTADHVVRAATVPCLVVPDGFRLPLRLVVAPVDPEEPSPLVATLALAWAAWLGADETRGPATTLELLAVVPDPAVDAATRAERVLGDLRAALSERAAAGGRASATAIRTVVRHDTAPADGILHHVAEVHGDLVVLGTHAPGTVRRAVLGSVASAVTRASPAPVLLVPPALWREGDRH